MVGYFWSLDTLLHGPHIYPFSNSPIYSVHVRILPSNTILLLAKTVARDLKLGLYPEITYHPEISSHTLSNSMSGEVEGKMVCERVGGEVGG